MNGMVHGIGGLTHLRMIRQSVSPAVRQAALIFIDTADVPQWMRSVASSESTIGKSMVSDSTGVTVSGVRSTRRTSVDSPGYGRCQMPIALLKITVHGLPSRAM